MSKPQSRVRWLATSMLAIAACGSRSTTVIAPPPAVVAADSAIRAAVAGERAIDASSFPAGAVGVAPFRVFSSDSTLAVLGFGLADLLMTDLARSREVQVVDRLRIDALVREMGLSASGYADTSGAARFGRIIGARRMVLGSLTTLEQDRARIDGRVGDVLTGTIQATDVAPTTLSALLDAEKAFAFAVFDQLGVVLSPAERALVEQRPTRNLAALLAYSRGVRAELQLDYRGASREYREALRRDPGFRNASSSLQRMESNATLDVSSAPPDLVRAGALALQAVNAPTMPQVSTAADPAFRQRMLTTIIIILNLP